MENPVLFAKELSVGYGKKIVVDGVSFEVKAGEILTLIGPNGAGKSTVLRSISAQLPVISGKVVIGGKQLGSMNERELSRLISLLLTDKPRAERMTCEDMVATGRYPYTGRLGILGTEDRAQVAEAMRLTAVEQLRDSDFRQISDGQKQSVMLARAIAQQPTVMLLDEPTSYLDISHKLKLLTLLRALAKEKNIAVIQSLHELDLAQKFSDKVLCIRGGRAERCGEPDEIFTDGYISQLYGIEAGSYDALYGSAEPQPAAGEPRVFVIGGGGSGVHVYRKLQRQGVPFAAGVIHENDLELPVAKRLASRLITERAFEPIGEAALQRAMDVMKSCGEVICCAEGFGTMNKANELLVKAAKAENKLTERAAALG